jgi:hypothetical protein
MLLQIVEEAKRKRDAAAQRNKSHTERESASLEAEIMVDGNAPLIHN